MDFEIEEESNEEGNESDAERSEPQYSMFTIFHIIVLILRFLAMRRRQYLLRLLQHFTGNRDLQIVMTDDEDEDISRWGRSRRRNPPDPDRFPKVPSDRGTELMQLGIFGSNDTDRNRGAGCGRVDKRKRLARRLLDRELARENLFPRKENQRLMAQVR